MNWLANNWFWLLFGTLFVLIHVFGHGGHGGHGAHRSRDRPDERDTDTSDRSPPQAERDGSGEAQQPPRPHH